MVSSSLKQTSAETYTVGHEENWSTGFNFLSPRGVIRTRTSGRDSVTFRRARNCWFVGNIPVCRLGRMMFGITVKDIDGSATWFPARQRR
ncbi:unnamed protein product [Spirodela intermedia]|uniref:Uncharacterized protein n=1 Tax=Spirodela intermedia TaxID=51605 RepID=A0A7I8K4J5_SPIIN|nr:unnamed protein product [Spirodela intermedia]